MTATRCKYEITVEQVGPKYRLYAEKKYGDGLGCAVAYDSPQKVLAEIRRHFKLWQTFDSILGRMSDPVTEANTCFESNTSLVTVAMVFHPEQKLLLECMVL
jgi:hypothetical protein